MRVKLEINALRLQQNLLLKVATQFQRSHIAIVLHTMSEDIVSKLQHRMQLPHDGSKNSGRIAEMPDKELVFIL